MRWLSILSVLLCMSIVIAGLSLPKGPPGNSSLTPLILVPGDGGNQVYARYKGEDYFCPVSKDWFLIWVNLEFLLPFTEHCIKTYFSLHYNATTHLTEDIPGLQTGVMDWGNTSTVEYLDTRDYGFLDYYGTLVNNLVQKMGYVRGVNLRGAPYDFRRALNDNKDFVPKLKALVEDTYRRNGNARVMLAAHSMGNLYTLFFLRAMDKSWKKKFVRGYVAVSAPIGGAVKSIRAMTAGDRLSEILLVGPVRDVLRTMPSTPFLFPSPHFWRDDEIIARRPSRNYTVANYRQLFEDMPYMTGWSMYKDVEHLVDPLWVPDVDELYCAHGITMETPGVLTWGYDFEFPTFQPSVTPDDGDGTVNIRSLLGCTRWPLKKHLTYPHAEHVKTLRDMRFVADMMSILKTPDKLRD